jgi:hypothetical protein
MLKAIIKTKAWREYAKCATAKRTLVITTGAVSEKSRIFKLRI